MDTVQPNSKRASCKHWMTKLLFILIIKDRRRQGKWLVASHFIQSLIYPSRWLFFIWLLAFLLTFPAATLITSLSERKIDTEWPGNQEQKSDTKALKPACSEKHLPVGISERALQMLEREYVLCVDNLQKKKDHLMYFLIDSCGGIMNWW